MTEKTKQIRELRQLGKTYKEISEITGLSSATISYHIANNGKEKVHQRNKQNRKKWITLLRVEYGNQCKICGYDKCEEALEFHHLDSTQKDGNVANLVRGSLKQAREEAKKCILLCCRCHREIHSGFHKEYVG